MVQQLLKLFSIAVISILVSACGGGGGGDSSDNVNLNEASNKTSNNLPQSSLASINISTPAALSTMENNGIAALTISLGSQPTAEVQIALSSSDLSEGSITPEIITFTPENWSQSQTIFAHGVDDNEADGNITFNMISAAAVSDDDQYDGLNPVDVSIVNMDDETFSQAAILISDITGLTTMEGADSASFSIRLSSPPTSSTTIGLLTTDASEGFVSPESITFTPENWNRPKIINVIGQDDLTADGSTTYAIITKPAISADPDYNELDASDVVITNMDNETRPLINNFSIDSDSVAYADATTIRWDSNAQRCQTAGATADGQWQDSNLPASGSRLISNLTNAGEHRFTITCSTNNITSNTQTVDLAVMPQSDEPSITLAASRSTDINYAGTTTLSWSAPGANSCIASGGWSGNKAPIGSAREIIHGLTEDTTFTLRCSNPAGTSTASVEVKVKAAAPLLDYFHASPNQIDQGRSTTLAWQSQDITECKAVSTPPNSNWNGKIDVTNGIGVTIENLAETTSFTLNCMGVDGSDVSKTLTVSVRNASIVVSPTQGLNTSESGTSASFEVVLDTKPLAPTSINLHSSDPSEGSINPDSITFNSDNWNIPQSITVTGQDDLMVDGDKSYQIITDPAVSADPVYHNVNAANVTVVNSDNDVQPIVNRFTASATSISFGSPVTLSWESDGDSCTASGSTAGGQWQSSNLPSSGTRLLANLTQAGSNTFSLTCKKAGINSEVSSIIVNVAPQIDAPTINLVADPAANVAYNSPVILTWSSTDTTSCSASGGWSGSRALTNTQGEVINNLTENTMFTLSCTGPGGSSSSTVSVTVTPANPAIDFFSASAAAITEGDPVTLSWQTNDINSCTASASPNINGWSGSLAPNNINGQVVSNIHASTTFTLHCVGIDGTRISETITVITEPPQPTVTLVASPENIDFNGETVLTWSSTDSTSCTASDGWTGQRNTDNSSGESISGLTSNTSFTLTCIGPGGSASVTKNVSVTPANPGIIVFNADIPTLDQGGSTTLSWLTNDISSCEASAVPENSNWSQSTNIGNDSSLTINNILETTTFTLSCIGIDNTLISQSVQVTVNDLVEIAGDINRGRQLYLNPIPNSGYPLSCADCHGADGLARIAPRDIHVTPCHLGRCEDEDILAIYTSNAMPPTTEQLCDAQCGRDIAAYLFSEVINQSTDDSALPIANSAFFNGVSPLPDRSVLRKAAILIAGRLPTEAELESAGDREQMKQALMGMMQGPGFDAFIEESVNDRLLTNALTRGNVINEREYPRINTHANNAILKSSFANAFRKESQELVKYVINNDLPYTEILTADYTMVNPESAYVYEAELLEPFPEDATSNTFMPAKVGVNMDGRLTGDFPHAGLLTQPSYLAKWQSTDTNLNRARARVTAELFLGLDLEALAIRQIDTSSTFNELNPTLNNPNCTICHNVVDPIAGTFQNWGNTRHEYRNRNHNGYYSTLGSNYVFNSRNEFGVRHYQPGDLWYKTMLRPGYPFTGQSLPLSNNPNALQWLGNQIANDTLFDTGTVKFWYEAVFGRKSLQPVIDSNPVQETAYNAQSLFFEGIGQLFRASGHDFKNMLAELILSPWFRAANVDSNNFYRKELNEIGMGRLLTPEQLDRKFKTIFGRSWNGLINGDFYLNYGGFNSGDLDTRNDQMTTIMSSTIDFIANNFICSAVRNDFELDQSSRILFPHVTINETPENAELAIRNNLVYLHNRILGEQLEHDDIEIDISLNLYTQLLNASAADNVNAPCTLRPGNTLTQRTWMAMLKYFIGTYEFLYE